MVAGRRAFNPWSQGLYSSNSFSLSRSFVLIPLMASAVEWSCPNKVTSTTLGRVWDPHAIFMLAGNETLSGAISMAASANEGVAPLPAMT